MRREDRGLRWSLCRKLRHGHFKPEAAAACVQCNLTRRSERSFSPQRPRLPRTSPGPAPDSSGSPPGTETCRDRKTDLDQNLNQNPDRIRDGLSSVTAVGQ
ncbi:hypothetical protein INR49_020583 [Caranx melampygus]|nr:hypothetical protein INR49_020583 [Caranx melampygus]